jgi:uncharacterized protein involved in outer membrane biogenesis
VAVGAVDGVAGAGPVARTDRLDLRIRLRPLFLGKIVIDEIFLRRPLLAFVVRADGSTNRPTLDSSGGARRPGGDILPGPLRPGW